MGKKQHQQDKLYLTSSEWKNFFGGKKTDATTSNADLNEFRRLPFNCCALSFQPFKHPYCTREGHVFDLECIAPFLKKYGKNPINGEKLDAKSLIKMTFYKNSKDQFHCPVTFKVFNENTHIVCIAKTGNVFAADAVEQLNVKVNYFKDLLNDEPFVKKDIITIQDPSNLSKFNMSEFFFLKENLKWELDDTEARKNPNFYLNSVSSEAKSALDELEKTYTAPSTSASGIKKSAAADSVNAAAYSTGRVAASFTSTVADIVTKQEAAIIDEDEIRYARVKKLGKKGYVCLATNFGRLNIELYCDQVPKTCENFLKHCANKYYKDTTFHRLIKNFMIQGGDPTGTGTGGESIWSRRFEDEFKPNLSHNCAGILSMANSGPNTNKSQFFITFRQCTYLDGKHTVFGKVVGGLDVLRKMELVDCDKKERPKVSIKIEDCLVFVDPYQEVDNQLLEERMRPEKEKAEAELRKQKEEQNKPMKPLREGVGKYISKQKLSATSASDEFEQGYVSSAAKKVKTSSFSKGFGDFSAW